MSLGLGPDDGVFPVAPSTSTDVQSTVPGGGKGRPVGGGHGGPGHRNEAGLHRTSPLVGTCVRPVTVVTPPTRLAYRPKSGPFGHPDDRTTRLTARTLSLILGPDCPSDGVYPLLSFPSESQTFRLSSSVLPGRGRTPGSVDGSLGKLPSLSFCLTLSPPDPSPESPRPGCAVEHPTGG